MFLDQLAAHIVKKTGGDFRGYCFVFPNRRSGLFFKRFLVKHSATTTWAPEILTINELMVSMSGLASSDPLDLLFTLYDAYRDIAVQPESFDEFFPWGEMMITDFDTLDKYLVDPDSIFRNIRELKEIDEAFGGLDREQVDFIRKFWKSFYQGKDTREKDLFLSTWNLLPKLYRRLNECLDKKNEGYEGRIYRKVAETEMTDLHHQVGGQHYVFIGFNALSKSEKQLFRKLKKRNAASFYWDFDERYLEDEHMEAGRFLRANMEEFPQEPGEWFFDSREHDQSIRIFDLPSDILQAKMVNRILSEREDKIREANDTAIIACDENLLMPVLSSLPDRVDLVNITMGYPFSNTPLYSFVEGILRLYRNVGKNRKGKTRYYNRDVLSVLNHQYFRLISGRDPGPVIQQIIDENRIYITPGYFEGSFEKLVFGEVSTARGLRNILDELLRFILSALGKDSKHHFRELEREYVLVMLSRLNKLTRITEGREDIELHTFMRLFRRVISGQRIPFTGEPLAGLQVMGILETRLLDFEHVIMLSVNEDVMPDTSTGHSFIPYSLRYAYGLPTREEMDAIYAYYFYRVIQRAKQVDLLYKSASDGIRSGEMSRYLYQLIYERGAEVIRPVMPVSSSLKRSITIEKRPEVMRRLEKYLDEAEGDRFLSPSSLNTYIECPLRFYFRKIAGIGEKDELLEEVDEIGFGNILHQTIHNLYLPLAEKNELVTGKELEGLLGDKELTETLAQVFRSEFYGRGKDRDIEGRNLVILEIIKKYLVRIIRTDIELVPLELLSLEEDHVMSRKINVRGDELKVRLGGKIDRVDRLHTGITRIIDYKTGKADPGFESIDALFDGTLLNRNKAAFQAFVYALLYQEKHPGLHVQPGLYVVRNLFGKDYVPYFSMGQGRNRIPVLSFQEYREQFDGNVVKLLHEIYNPEIPFSQTEITEHCRNCDFRDICDR